MTLKTLQKITRFLWFDHQAEEAVDVYPAVLKNSRIRKVARYDEAGKDAYAGK